MRIYKFRGWMSDDSSDQLIGEWVYGDLNVSLNGDAYITEKSDGVELSYPVEAESVGYFTGLVDCKGNEIYEGDIVASDLGNRFGARLEVVFSNGLFCIGHRPIPSQDMIECIRLTVVGNSYEIAITGVLESKVI